MYFVKYNLDMSGYLNAKTKIKNDSIVHGRKVRMLKTNIPLVCDQYSNNFEGENINSATRGVAIDGSQYVKAVGGIHAIQEPLGKGGGSWDKLKEVSAELADVHRILPSEKISPMEYESGMDAPYVPIGAIPIKQFLEQYRVVDTPFIRIGRTYEEYISFGDTDGTIDPDETYKQYLSMPEVMKVFDKASPFFNAIPDDDFGLVGFSIGHKYKSLIANSTLNFELYTSDLKASVKNRDILPVTPHTGNIPLYVSYKSLTEPQTLYEDSSFATVITEAPFVEGTIGYITEYYETGSGDGAPVETVAISKLQGTAMNLAKGVSTKLATLKAGSTTTPSYDFTFTEGMADYDFKEQFIVEDTYTEGDAVVEVLMVMHDLLVRDMRGTDERFTNTSDYPIFYMKSNDFKKWYQEVLLEVRYYNQVFEEVIGNIAETPIGALLNYGLDLNTLLDITFGRISYMSLGFKVCNKDDTSWLSEKDYSSDVGSLIQVKNALGEYKFGKVIIPITDTFTNTGSTTTYVVGYELNWKELKKLSPGDFMAVMSGFYGYINTHTPKKKTNWLREIVKVVAFVVISVLSGGQLTGVLAVLFWTGVALVTIGMLTQNSKLMLIGSVMMMAAGALNGLASTANFGEFLANVTVPQALKYAIQLATFVQQYQGKKDIEAREKHLSQLSEKENEVDVLITTMEKTDRVKRFVYEECIDTMYTDIFKYEYEYKYM